MKNIVVISTITSLFLLSGCSTKHAGMVGEGTNVKYGDAKAVETVTADFGSTDLQNSAESLAQSLLESRFIANASQPPKVRLRTVANKTYEHIDTKAITDKIRIKLLKSGQVRFLADTGNLNELELERELETTAKNMPNITDSDYIVTGTVRSIKKSAKDIKDVYYNISLELVDSKSGEVVWADEKEIRKTTSKNTIGW